MDHLNVKIYKQYTKHSKYKFIKKIYTFKSCHVIFFFCSNNLKKHQMKKLQNFQLADILMNSLPIFRFIFKIKQQYKYKRDYK